jgi:hypothetical protein
MKQFILMLHEQPDQYTGMSPQQMQDVIARYSAWSRDMAQKGHLAGGEKLTDDGGRHLKRNAKGAFATDGPYAEAKDVIGGYFVMHANDMAHAEQLSASCPHLQGDNWIEIREIDPVAA